MFLIIWGLLRSGCRHLLRLSSICSHVCSLFLPRMQKCNSCNSVSLLLLPFFFFYSFSLLTFCFYPPSSFFLPSSLCSCSCCGGNFPLGDRQDPTFLIIVTHRKLQVFITKPAFRQLLAFLLLLLSGRGSNSAAFYLLFFFDWILDERKPGRKRKIKPLKCCRTNIYFLKTFHTLYRVVSRD